MRAQTLQKGKSVSTQQQRLINKYPLDFYECPIDFKIQPVEKADSLALHSQVPEGKIGKI